MLLSIQGWGNIKQEQERLYAQNKVTHFSHCLFYKFSLIFLKTNIAIMLYSTDTRYCSIDNTIFQIYKLQGYELLTKEFATAQYQKWIFIQSNSNQSQKFMFIIEIRGIQDISVV